MHGIHGIKIKEVFTFKTRDIVLDDCIFEDHMADIVKLTVCFFYVELTCKMKFCNTY
jgi:hypothetical protein